MSDLSRHGAYLAEAVAAALGLVLDLCAQRVDGPRLALEAVAVPIADYGGLSVADFMVSLYNDHSVQRLMIGAPDGARQPALEILVEAVEALHLISA